MKVLTENTAISVSLVVTIVTVTYWITSVANQGSASAAEISKIQQSQAQYNQDIHQIRTDMAVIKQEMKEIKDRIKNGRAD